LQAAPNATGAWSIIAPPQIGPFTTNVNAAPQTFFRLIGQ
jgi:hypothetical protein